jgi:hypothetical protein
VLAGLSNSLIDIKERADQREKKKMVSKLGRARLMAIGV